MERQKTVIKAWKVWINNKKLGIRRIRCLLKRKKHSLLSLSLRIWTQTSRNFKIVLRTIRKYVQKRLKFAFSRFSTRILKQTAVNFRSQLEILPHQLESDFAAVLETRIRAMKSDFEAERQQHLAQRAALLERQQALRQAFSRHADRLYKSLSRDFPVSEE